MAVDQQKNKTSVPARRSDGLPTPLGSSKISAKVPAVLDFLREARGDGAERIPNASLIYGVAAAAILAYSLFCFFYGLWTRGFLLWLPAGALIGYALHYIKNNE